MCSLETVMPASFVLFLHLLSASWTGGAGPSPDKRFVNVDVSLADTLLQPGGKGRILVTFRPVDGIHVNIDPPVTIKIEKNRLVLLHGAADMPTDKETGFLSTLTPVEQAFSVSPRAAPGEYTIRGTIIYYFCSDTEGWCRKQSQAATLTLNIQGP